MLFSNAGEEKHFVFFNEYKLTFFLYSQLFHVLIFLNTSFVKCLFRSLFLLRELTRKKNRGQHYMIMLTKYMTKTESKPI